MCGTEFHFSVQTRDASLRVALESAGAAASVWDAQSREGGAAQRHRSFQTHAINSMWFTLLNTLVTLFLHLLTLRLQLLTLFTLCVHLFTRCLCIVYTLFAWFTLVCLPQCSPCPSAPHPSPPPPRERVLKKGMFLLRGHVPPSQGQDWWRSDLAWLVDSLTREVLIRKISAASKMEKQAFGEPSDTNRNQFVQCNLRCLFGKPLLVGCKEK